MTVVGVVAGGLVGGVASWIGCLLAGVDLEPGDYFPNANRLLLVVGVSFGCVFGCAIY